ncbi:flavin monooxygenase-like protein [Endogone sp. FLAS-F59071]|nr:flavin monooxygenase-like protein [Endogone sp. FLAS-F59071]|eukprot:RUS21897.1 flavin monooxygenase-like protein [Endogone sp. FLAS-F59071]
MTKRVAVIGAGIGGLVAIKECLAAGLEPVCFESESYVGGLWHENENEELTRNTPMYKNLVINISRDILPFSDFPCPADWPTYLTRSYVSKYLDSYADHFNVRQHIHFNHRVNRVTQNPITKRWTVRHVAVKKDGRTPHGEEIEETFDWVLVCTGHFQQPHVPVFEGVEKFKGMAIHVANYSDPEPFKGKKVLVVGPGTSGCDIAVQLSQVAEVYLSARSGTWLAPRLDPLNRPIDLAINRIIWSFPMWLQDWYAANFLLPRPPGHLNPSHKFSAKWVPVASSVFYERVATGQILTTPEILRFADNGRDIEFVDGTIVPDVDFVLYATGYGFRFEFIDPEVFTDGRVTAQDEFDGMRLKKNWWLWQGIIPPKYEGIAFIGLLEILLQVRYIASLIAGRTLHPLPTPAEMDRQIVEFRKTIPRTHLVNYHPAFVNYFDWLAREAAGAAPDAWAVVREHGMGTLMKVLTGPITPVQWRLVGRDKWDGAKEVLEDVCQRFQGGILDAQVTRRMTKK